MVSSSPDSRCELFSGIYSYVMQMLIFVITLSVLALKNHFERTSGIQNRKCQEFFLDTLKQVVGAGLLHVFNLRTVVFSHSGAALPPCDKYFLEIMVDTTFGVFTVWAIFRLFWIAIRRYMAEEHAQAFKRGHYYADGTLRVDWFYKQLALWCVCVMLMKMVMLSFIHLFSFVLVPLTRWCLGAVESWPYLELFIVMVAVPSVMNTFQFWVQDNFLQASNSKAPSSANVLDLLFCFPSDHKFREKLQPLLRHTQCSCIGAGKGKGKGKGPALPKAEGKAKGKGKAKVSEPLPGPRPAEGLCSKRKLHWKPINFKADETIWDKIRANSTNGKVPELHSEDLEKVFMERRQKVATGRGRKSANSTDPSSADPDGIDGQRKSSRRLRVRLIENQKDAMHLELAYVQLQQRGVADVTQLDGALGRLEDIPSRTFSKVPEHEALEAILSFLEGAAKHEDVFQRDASSENPAEVFILKLITNSGTIGRMMARLKALMCKNRLQLTHESLQDQYSRLRDNVHHIIKVSVKLPELMHYSLQLGNYVNHGSDKGNAEAFDLSSLVTAFGGAKCKEGPRDREITVFHFLKNLLRKHRDKFWLEQLKQDLLHCCEARQIDSAELGKQVEACNADLEILQTFAESAGSEDPPDLRPEELRSFLEKTQESQRELTKLATVDLPQDRLDLLRFFALDPDKKENTIASVLDSLAAIHDEMFGGPLQQSALKSKPKMTNESEVDFSTVSVEVWLMANNCAGVNRAQLHYSQTWPFATWAYPLHIAVGQKSAAVVQMLLDANADPTQENQMVSGRQLTPLRLAYYYESSFSFAARNRHGAYEEVIRVLEQAEPQNAQAEDV